MLSGLMRPLVNEVCCVGTTKGCCLNSPPVDQSGPVGIWWAQGAQTVPPFIVGVSAAAVAPAALAVRGYADRESSKREWCGIKTISARREETFMRSRSSWWSCTTPDSKEWNMGHFVPLAELKNENIQCQAQTDLWRHWHATQKRTEPKRKKERKKKQ